MTKLDSLSNLLLRLLLDGPRFIRLSLRPHFALAAENLFLRKQLALYLERKVKPGRARDASRLTLVLLSSLFAWRRALTIVQPDTFIRWLCLAKTLASAEINNIAADPMPALLSEEGK